MTAIEPVVSKPKRAIALGTETPAAALNQAVIAGFDCSASWGHQPPFLWSLSIDSDPSTPRPDSSLGLSTRLMNPRCSRPVVQQSVPRHDPALQQQQQKPAGLDRFKEREALAAEVPATQALAESCKHPQLAVLPSVPAHLVAATALGAQLISLLLKAKTLQQQIHPAQQCHQAADQKNKRNRLTGRFFVALTIFG